MSESKTPSELTEPGDRTEAMMYWHERAMKAEADLAAARAEVERLRKDAERYRFIRDANRSDCITRELGLYAMESLDEYVDAAMDDEAALAAKEPRDGS